MRKKKENSRPSKSLCVRVEDERGLHYRLDVPGEGFIDIRIHTIDQRTGRVEFAAAIVEAQ